MAPVSVTTDTNSKGGKERIMEVDLELEELLEATPTPPPQVLFSGRTTDDVGEVMSVAKLDKADLQDVSQEILFDSNFSKKEYRLLQLDKEILGRIRLGEILVFRGDENDSAVLCTEKETYEIKDAETSNSLLLFKDILMPDVKSPTGSASSSNSRSPAGSANNSLNESELNDSVIQDGVEEDPDSLRVKPCLILDVAHSCLEMKKMSPNLSKIRFILRGSLYNEEVVQGSYEEPSDIVTLDTLLEKVSASKQEIRDYLEDARVVEMDGKLLLVDDDYLFRIFSQVLNCVDENSWSPTEIDKEVVVEAVSSLAEPFFIEKIFQWLLESVVDLDASASTSKIKYTYKEKPVCKFLGEVLLKTMGRFNLREFKKIWQESVPEGLTVNLNQLSGIAVYDEESSPPVIWHFPEYNLPETFTERLALLFETKRRWRLEEISPFLQVFSTASQNVDILLTKYARSSTVNGVKYYSSKHGK